MEGWLHEGLLLVEKSGSGKKQIGSGKRQLLRRDRCDVGAPATQGCDVGRSLQGQRFAQEALHAATVGQLQRSVLQEVQAYAKTKLASYKVPRVIHVVDAVPKSASGKILRRVLRDRVAAG